MSAESLHRFGKRHEAFADAQQMTQPRAY